MLKKHSPTIGNVIVVDDLIKVNYMDLVLALTTYAINKDKTLVFPTDEIRSKYLSVFGDYHAKNTALEYCMNNKDEEYLVLPLPREALPLMSLIMIKDRGNKYTIIR